MIWIRADANREIGMGHVMRCLSVAEALKKTGEQVCFLTADESAVPLLAEKGQEYRILHSDYKNPEGELECLEEMLREDPPRFFLADSYYVTAEYFRRVRAYAPAGYLDDKCLGGLPLDVLINYNIFAGESMYRGYEGTRLLLGTSYVPLREEFAGGCGKREARAEADRGREESVEGCLEQEGSAAASRGGRRSAGGCRVLVTTGGSDKYDLAGRFLEKVLAHRETAELKYCVVSGVYNVHLERLLELEEAYPNVHIYRNVSNMAGLMGECDIAFTAGGSTMYELSAMGVPMLCFSFVDNQERIVKGFADKGLVPFGGDYLAQGDAMLEEAAEKLAMLAMDGELRRTYRERLRQVVDGRGAFRIAEVLAGF